MIGIENIGVYIPENRQDSFSKIYDGKKVDADFVANKVGFISVARKSDDEDTSDMCQKAFQNLQEKINLSAEKIDCILVCTHNGDFQMPHTSAILQEKLSLNKNCAAFDVALACSGYVYSLNILKGFMELNNFSNGIIFTCDPCSKILNPEDKNADLLLGDAATATLLSTQGKFEICRTAFCTKGANFDTIIKKRDVFLSIDNRRVFNFVLREGANTIQRCLELNQLAEKDIDLFLFHQASKFVVEELGKKLNIPAEKIPFKAQEYGNTISSSLPLLMQNYLDEEKFSKILISGFGAGLSTAAAVIKRI